MIRVVHVARANANHPPSMLCEGLVAQTKQYLEAGFRQRLDGLEIPKKLSFYVLYGQVAKEIALFAERYQAGLIVMTKKNNFEFSRLLCGSQTLRVVRLATCPVLILKTSNPETKPMLVQQSSWSRHAQAFVG